MRQAQKNLLWFSCSLRLVLQLQSSHLCQKCCILAKIDPQFGLFYLWACFKHARSCPKIFQNLKKKIFRNFPRPKDAVVTYNLDFGIKVRAIFIIENSIFSNFNHNFRGQTACPPKFLNFYILLNSTPYYNTVKNRKWEVPKKIPKF